VVNFKKRFSLALLAFLMAMFSFSIQAKSFSADAVQIRNGQFSHARMFWSDGNVRFEYLENGVPMVQIYDVKNGKIIWLDTENKLFVQDDLNSEQMIDSMLKESKTSSDPCKLIKHAECTRLKEVNVNGRKAVKWLITTQFNGKDQHSFQWIDKEYNIVVRQENSDNSIIEVKIDDDQEMNGRKVRKLDLSFESNGVRSHGTQWYDAELNIIVRQNYQNGAEDELRNIKVEKISGKMFAIPKDYKEFDAEALASEPDFSDINGVAGPVNN
jgi:hypothetical protein